MKLKEFLKAQANALVDATRTLWARIGRLAKPYEYKKPLSGFRLARTGKHRGTMLSRHEQTRNPAGTKLWKACPSWKYA